MSKADLDDLRREAEAALRDVFAYAREGEPLSSGDHAYLDACQGKIAAFVAAAEQRVEALQSGPRPLLTENAKMCLNHLVMSLSKHAPMSVLDRAADEAVRAELKKIPLLEARIAELEQAMAAPCAERRCHRRGAVGPKP